MRVRVARGVESGIRTCGFAFVELLVVLGIISALAAMLMPMLTAARAQSQVLVCQSNVRRLLTAVQAYVGEYGQYPPNITRPVPGMCWHDQQRLGPFVSCMVASDRTLVGGIMVCPADEGAQRSYAMNVWASSKRDTFVKDTGTSWTNTTARNNRLILIAEMWGSAKLDGGWVTQEPFGYFGDTPGKRFGVNGGIPSLRPVENGLRVNCELPFARHRPHNSLATGTEPVGRVTIGYADGHVELKSNDELADALRGNSTLDSLWSPLDPSINQPVNP